MSNLDHSEEIDKKLVKAARHFIKVHDELLALPFGEETIGQFEDLLKQSSAARKALVKAAKAWDNIF